MAIRKSAAAEIQELTEALTSADPVVRETAAARLSAIGQRVVPHLLGAFSATRSNVARASILKILESTRDRRGLGLAVEVSDDPAREPAVTAAAVNLLGAFLDDEQTRALEVLGAMAVDQDRPDLERLAAWQMLERMPERILAPLRKRLGRDRSPAVRRMVAVPRLAAPDGRAALDPGETIEGAALGDRVDPIVLVEALSAGGAAVPLTILHHLVERTRTRQAQEPAEADRLEWLKARGAVHLALARRGSRVALYDVHDTLSTAAAALPEGFVSAAALVGDGRCLEAVSEALARVPASADRLTQQWRGRLIAAGRAIVYREGLTRRHAVVRRITRKHPDVARALF